MANHLLVTHVRIVAHTVGLMGSTSQMSHNHWSIYLILQGGSASVRINMAAKPGYITGNLEVTNYDYILTNSAIRHWDYPTVQGLAVQHVLDMIFRLRHHLYNMSGGGSGCRYWVYVILQDLAQQGWVHASAPQNMWPDLLFLYSRLAPRQPLDMVYGEFVPE